MSSTVRNVLGVLAGLVAGSIANMAVLMVGISLVPPPSGVDFSDPASLKAGAHLLEARHFISPFLAHAAGSLVGGLTATLIAASNQKTLALVIGGLFLLGGLIAAFIIPAPGWFIALDLVVSYLPMAWLGWRLATAVKA